ncbi:MAG: glycosyltransferase family 4 protein [Caldilineaceae bacterium]
MKSRTINKTAPPLLLVDLSEGYGGVDVHALDLAKALHGRRPYGVATVAGSPLHNHLTAAGLCAEPVPHPKRDPRNLLALRHIIHRGGYQLVDAHNEQSWLWGLGAAKLAGVRGLIATVHLPWRVIPGGFKGYLQEQLLHTCRRWGAHFVTVSHSIAAQLQAIRVPPTQIEVIYNAIEPTANGAVEPCAIAGLTGWPAASFVVVVVGRLTAQKGHHFLLSALAQVRQQYPQVRGLIVGEGKLRPQLERQAAALGLTDHVHFTGFRQDIPALLAGSDLFCLPSYAEGLPYAALEAAQCRLPLLLSAVDGIRELFTHNETAYLTAVGDVAALANGIAWFVEQPAAAERMGEAAHTFIRQNLDPATMVAAKERLYQRVAAGCGPFPCPAEQSP